jgi:hypothetical protein
MWASFAESLVGTIVFPLWFFHGVGWLRELLVWIIFFVEQVGSDNYDLIFCVRSHIPIIAAASRGNDRNRRHKTESKMLGAIQETWRRVQSHVRIRHWAWNRVWYLHGKEPENCSSGLQPCHVPHLLPRLVRPLSLANLQILGLAAFSGWW